SMPLKSCSRYLLIGRLLLNCSACLLLRYRGHQCRLPAPVDWTAATKLICRPPLPLPGPPTQLQHPLPSKKRGLDGLYSFHNHYMSSFGFRRLATIQMNIPNPPKMM